MGTRVSVITTDPDHHTVAVDLVRATFDAWEARFSRFRVDSELSRLNAGAGHWHPASPEMLNVLAASLEAARVSDGLFDPTLLVRLRELGYDDDFARLPAERTSVRLARWTPNRWSEVELDREARRIRLPAAVELDLGGIAKGMAVDAASAELDRLRIGPAAINAGGDVGVVGDVRGGWPVALDDAPGTTVVIRRGALATSSTLRRRWRVGGVAHHHLVDPRTGMPASTGVASATVAAPTCRAAEIAAKVALLLGPRDAAPFLIRRRLAGLLVMDDASTWRLGNWEAAA